MKIRYPEGSPVNKKGFLILLQEFKCGEWRFRQLKRIGLIALYEKITKNVSNKFYEVIIIQENPEYEVAGNKISAREAFCRDEDFGDLAWAYSDLPSAEEKFNQLINKK